MVNVEALTQEWLRLDRDEATRAEILNLVKQQNVKVLETLLTSRLTFGTAGLRARMGAGFSRLNSLTIIQTTQGLAQYLLEQQGTSAASAGVVIGYDGRHNSKKFAELAAAAFIAKGFRVLWYEDLVHTPMVPFAVKELQAAAGVMVTASHNPKQDNGYKVYGSNACQINSPVDAQIADAILNNLEPVSWDIENNGRSKLLIPILERLRASYLETVHQYVGSAPKVTSSSLEFVYTPMHGVGLVPMEAILKVVDSHDRIVVVHEQAQPDAEFPTVVYPNPEENGALDLAKATADQDNIRLILANDPDADRFAVAEKVDDGSWHQFTGDQVGVLLSAHLAKIIKPERTGDDWMLTTAVSSQMLSVLAEAQGFVVEETLTGFKWLGNRSLALQSKGKRVHFAYEEALGYMFPDIVHDKDGIAAAVVFLRACKDWPSCSPWAKLQELYRDYGYFHTINTYWRSPDMAATSAVFDQVRCIGKPHPKFVGGRVVVRWRDLTVEYDSSTGDHTPDLPVSKGSQMITCWLEKLDGTDEGIRFTVRASGTEPKIKIYLECHSNNPTSAETGAAQMLERIKLDWFNDPCLIMEKKP
ncbi:MAG: Phosphoglucomutase-3 [Alectoria sarmentosa]|nr:MAG: Phosphoglucomutase-3 [Alectoria sarmentosa]